MSYRVEIITYEKGPDTLLKALFRRPTVKVTTASWPSLCEQDSWLSAHFEAVKLTCMLNMFSTHGGKCWHEYRVMENLN